MNIRLKAALEVAGAVAFIMVIVAGVQIIAKYIVETYGAETAANAAAFCFMSVAAYVCVGLLYDYRVAQLKYKAKLEEMVNK